MQKIKFEINILVINGNKILFVLLDLLKLPFSDNIEKE